MPRARDCTPNSDEACGSLSLVSSTGQRRQMSESKDAAKAAKKLAKSRAKALKKGAVPPDSAPRPKAAAGSPQSGPTPAERSADAAEQHVLIRRRQMGISLAVAIIALTTFTLSVSDCWPTRASKEPPEQTTGGSNGPASE